MTLRLDADIVRRLDALAEATDRSKAWLANQALRGYLELNDWQVQEIRAALKQADKPNAKLVEHSKVEKWLATWGTTNERRPPR